MNLMLLIKSEEDLKDEIFFTAFVYDENSFPSYFQVAKDSPGSHWVILDPFGTWLRKALVVYALYLFG